MVWRNVARALIAVGEGLSKAFAKAVREEIRGEFQLCKGRFFFSQSTSGIETGERSGTSSSANDTREAANANARLGISLQVVFLRVIDDFRLSGIHTDSQRERTPAGGGSGAEFPAFVRDQRQDERRPPLSAVQGVPGEGTHRRGTEKDGQEEGSKRRGKRRNDGEEK